MTTLGKNKSPGGLENEKFTAQRESLVMFH